MNIWHTLRTLMEAVALTEIILGKDVATPGGASLGTAVDIELDLMRNKIWVTVENQGRWSRIPSEQITGQNDKTALVEGWLPAYSDII
jgi:hypothetical protein